ncbi:MAG TPA: CDP-alcohol phosphatidyltransferase family protein [Vicinamibacterales bacterium]|nr:CDP-alcohol phosphatidyltransferase family protein [Vicinamibacterales bacterium]
MGTVGTVTSTTAAHVRDNSSLTAGVEKRLLVWIAQRLPRAVNPDHLSALGLSSMALAGLAFTAFRVTPWAALGVCLALTANWFGDSLDGTLARVRRQQRPRYGFYVDHIIDIAGTTLMVAGMACSGLMNPLVAGAVLAGFLLVSSESYLATHASGVFRMSFVGFGPTELRLLIMAGVVRAAFDPLVAPFGAAPVRLFDLGGIAAAMGLVIAFAVAAVRNTRALYLAEPLPKPDEGRAA